METTDSKFLIRVLLGLSVVSILLLFSWYSIQMAPDSPGYLTLSPLRAPGYALFVYVVNQLGDSLTPVVILQLCLGHLAAMRFVLCWRHTWALGTLGSVALFVLLLTPYLGKVGTYILSESLAYPIWLLALNYWLQGLLQRNLKPCGLAAVCMLALMLIRGQFIFLIPAGLLSLGYLWPDVRKIQQGAVLLVAVVMCAWGLESGYHSLFHGRFARTPFTSVHTLAAPLYLSDAQTASKLNPNHQALFQSMQQQASNLQLNQTFCVGHVDAPYHYISSYDRLVYSVIIPTLQRFKYEDPFQQESICQALFLDWLSQHWARYAQHVSRNLLAQFGHYYLFLGYITLLLWSIIAYRRQQQADWLILGTIMMFGLCNAGVIAAVQAFRIRYAFYTELLWFASCVLILAKRLNKDAR